MAAFHGLSEHHDRIRGRLKYACARGCECLRRRLSPRHWHGEDVCKSQQRVVEIFTVAVVHAIYATLKEVVPPVHCTLSDKFLRCRVEEEAVSKHRSTAQLKVFRPASSLTMLSRLGEFSNQID